MPTRITFAAQRGDNPLGVTVQEAPDQVMKAWIAAQGLPFSLTREEESKVYINPATVAFWQETKAPRTVAVG
jgi:antitoxin component of RelBE/YafQ-DinJ toxin-antitoxin module